MIKGYFCDSVLRLLSNFQYSKSEFLMERRDVESYIDEAIGQAVKAEFWNNYNAGDRGDIDGGWLTPFTVSVQKDNVKNLYYSILPITLVALERDLGMYQISPIGNDSEAFIIERTGTAALFKGLESSNGFGEIIARRIGNKVYYYGMSEMNKSDEVDMLLVGSTLEIPMGDELRIPTDSIATVRQYVVNILSTGIGKNDTATDQTRA